MTEASKGGVALAKHIASYYAENLRVKAVLIGGSVSRNWADGYSDLELGIFWDGFPSDEERQAVVEQVGGELWTFHPYRPDSQWVVNEHWGLEQVTLRTHSYSGTSMISTNHFTVSAMVQCLADVVEKYDTAIYKQVLIAAIQNGVSLHGNQLIKRWQKRAASFPDELAIKIVQENLWFGPWFCPEAYIERNDTLVLVQHFVWAQQSILRVLAALNRVYFVSSEYKWLDAFAATLSIVPPDLVPRMRQVFGVDTIVGWRQLKSLIYETIDLVEEHLPAVNTVSLFKEHPEINIAWARKRWETHHPYTLLQNVGSNSAP